ncbi:MAG: DUF2189 domain-containing protein [Proteobacteria bacterium]|nr:DUF2189 domain-containing protein [Pseudomonadota bacterium]
MVELTHQQKESAFEDICLSAKDIQINRIGLRDLWQSLREGYDDYGAKPSSIALLILFYFLFALVFSLFAFGQEMRYLVFPMVAGFNLIGPIVAIAFFEMSRRREKGLDMNWRSSFRFIHTHSFAPILALSFLMMVLYVSWVYMAELIYFGLFGENPPSSMADFINQVLTTRRGGALIAYGNFVGFLFAFAAMALSVVAFPLALDKPVTAMTAITVSIKAFSLNVYVLAVWGIVVVVFIALGAALFLIGLAVALPILGHATWHLYRKIVVNQS